MFDILAGLPACLLETVPRDADTDAADGDRHWLRRLSALSSAYHTGRPVAVSWWRERRGGPVSVVIAGDGLFGSVTTGSVTTTLPAGGQARPLDGTSAAARLTEMPYWQPVALTPDGLLTEGRREPTERHKQPSLEDCLLSAWDREFAWLLVAKPIPPDEVDKLRAEVAELERDAWRKRDQSPRAAVEAERLRHRHRELAMGASTGAWRVWLAAGGESQVDTQRIAGLICAAADLRDESYALRPFGQPTSAEELSRTRSSPEAVGTRLVSALARPPTREIPGLRFVLPAEFDVTPEQPDNPRQPDDHPELKLGTVLDRDRRSAGLLLLSRSSLNRHTFVCGATGAGKSQTTRGLLEAASRHGIPWLVVEPAKAEYRAMAARLPDQDVIVVRPGALASPPAGMNPLEPGTDTAGNRFPLQTHLDLVRALFLAAFDAEEPFPQVLSQALTRCYTEAGWDLVLGTPLNPDVIEPRYPSLRDLERAALRVVDDIGYGREVRDNIRGFVTVRIASLRLGTTGRFLEGGHPIDFHRLLRSNVVFEIEDVGDDRDKAFVMGTVLIRLTEYLRLERLRDPSAVRLRHLSVFEEAHRLLRDPGENGGAAAHAVEMFAGLLAEIRAYGEGLVIAEQIPGKLLPDVVKNTAVKVVHRLPAADDRAVVGATMNLTETQSRFVVSLATGEAAVFTSGMDHPLMVKMDDGSDREGTAVAPASPVAIVDPRSLTCDPDCRSTPCTLADLRAARRLAETEPILALWSELVVVAHLTGWPTPSPGPDLRETSRVIESRLLRCALSHAVDIGVAARTPVFAERFGAGAFAVHVLAVVERLLRGDQHHDLESEWLGAPYRWSLLRSDLAVAFRTNPTAGRHPETDSWETRYRRRIPGETVRRQLEHVVAWHRADQRDVGARDVTVFGTGATSTIESVLGAKRTDPTWSDRVDEAFGQFTGIRKPLWNLFRQEPRRGD